MERDENDHKVPHTPIEENHVMEKEGTEVDKQRYQQIVGILAYLSNTTRPD